VAKKRNEEMNK